ncbi:hypothetical protein M271_25965 [Streptomyces rapamycinicus NRRL 5491]|nr:hypothetical protein M271_25965 [Streptomyces rapamycinicus NRRL 5491]
MPTRTRCLAFFVAGRMTVTVLREKPFHSGPVKVGLVLRGGAETLTGFPESHFTTGRPRSSTKTAVPAWRTADTGFTPPR